MTGNATGVARMVNRVILLVLLTGCSKASGAKERFSEEFTCPEDRVEVRARNDLTGSKLRVQVPPPPEVAADPARLAQYKEKEAETNANADGMGDIYEARGCNKQSLYSCRIRTNKTFGVSCTSVHYIDGVSRW